MRILLLYCHPLESSFCSAIHQQVIDTLKQGDHELRDRDLYAEGFDPVLSREERLDYFENDNNQTRLAKDIEDIRWAEGLIFVYPTWWGGLPAMLKGWLDRVWLPNVVFTLSDSLIQPLKPQMTNIRYFAAVTTHGASWWITKWAGEAGKKTLLGTIRPLCHPRCRTTWYALYQLDSCSQQEREQFLNKIKEAFSRL